MAAPVALPIDQRPSPFSLENVGRKFQDYEYVISSIATTIIASLALISTGGTIAIGFVAEHLILGAFLGFINHHFSKLAIACTRLVSLSFYYIFSSQRSVVRLDAAIATIESTTTFKTIRAALNILATAVPFSGLTESLMGKNILISSAFLLVGSILLVMKSLPHYMNVAYRNRLEARIQRLNAPGFLDAIIRNNFERNDGLFVRAVDHVNDIRFRQAQAGIGNDDQWITRAINRCANIPEFQENLEDLMPVIYPIIARETIIEIISTLPTPGMLRDPGYPSSFIPITIRRDSREIHVKRELSVIHRKFKSLSEPLQNEVKRTINNETGPENETAKAVWKSIRDFSSYNLLQGNQGFSVACQRAIQNRRPPQG